MQVITNSIRRARMRLWRVAAGIEMVVPAHASGKECIFLIGDLHFGHKNIIKYCRRPFLIGDSQEMDRVLIRNWNLTVRKKDTVYVLGDFSFSRMNEWWYYARMLNGQKVFLQGSHDNFGELKVLDSVELFECGEKFLLIHSPTDAPPDYTGWIVHGHHHNNHPNTSPFISYAKRTVNVSVELIGYRPIDFEKLAGHLHQGVLTGLMGTQAKVGVPMEGS